MCLVQGMCCNNDSTYMCMLRQKNTKLWTKVRSNTSSSPNNIRYGRNSLVRVKVGRGVRLCKLFLFKNTVIYTFFLPHEYYSSCWAVSSNAFCFEIVFSRESIGSNHGSCNASKAVGRNKGFGCKSKEIKLIAAALKS